MITSSHDLNDRESPHSRDELKGENAENRQRALPSLATTAVAPLKLNLVRIEESKTNRYGRSKKEYGGEENTPVRVRRQINRLFKNDKQKEQRKSNLIYQEQLQNLGFDVQLEQSNISPTSSELAPIDDSISISGNIRPVSVVPTPAPDSPSQ